MNQLIEELKPDFEKIINHLKEELSGLRTGRATPALVENLLVEAYNTKTPLKHLGSITVPDSKTLIIQLWDKNIMTGAEKTLSQSDKGFSISVEGQIIRLNLPALSEERRKDICKVIHERLEGARVAVREIRDKAKEKITKMFRDKELTEDDKYLLYEDLDKLTSEYNDKIKEIGRKKEEEVMTI